MRLTGKVKWFSDKGGYGFIIPDDGSEEVFAHRTNFAPPLTMLTTDQRVSFEVVPADKGNGKKAVAVQSA